MSVQDPIACSNEGADHSDVETQPWLRLTVGMAFCFLVIFAWTSGAVNAAQILAVTIVVSVGLSARAVLKIDEIDANGMQENAAMSETVAGTAVLSLLAAVALVVASSFVAPLSGVVNFILFNIVFGATFAAAVAAEGLLSAVTCYVLKPFLTKSAIGAEIAVMLNIQQKFQARLA